jgi:uncharacterized membrane protein YfcA
MSPLIWAWVCCVGFGAGWVRGYAGFGFSVLCMAGLTWSVSPSLVVPVIVVLEMTASVLMWRGSVASADRGWLKTIVGVNFLTVPIGMAMLLFLPSQPLRVVVALLLLIAAIALRFVVRSNLEDTPMLRRFCGAGSGLLNGIAASGGVVAALTMTASGMPSARLRATMILYLLFADALVISAMVLATWLDLPINNTLIDGNSLKLSIALGIPMALGIYMGQRFFHRAVSVDFRQFVLNLLMVMSTLSLLLIVLR